MKPMKQNGENNIQWRDEIEETIYHEDIYK